MCSRPLMMKDRAEDRVMKEGRKVIGLGAEGSLFDNINL